MDVRNEFALAYKQLQAWQPGDAVSADRRAKLLQIGYMIGTGGAALLSAQTHLIPYLQSLSGPVTAASQGAGGLMLLWTKAANAAMTHAASMGALSAIDAALSFGPAVLLGVGVVLLFWAASKSKPRITRTEYEDESE